MNATLQISGIHGVGETQYGQRRLLDVSGGRLPAVAFRAHFNRRFRAGIMVGQ